MQDKRINAGYEIIKSFPVGNTEFVLGENIHDRARYVTWECTGATTIFGVTTSRTRRRQQKTSTTVLKPRSHTREASAVIPKRMNPRKRQTGKGTKRGETNGRK